mgnify:CR=1 FL=1|jgi:hypothetical protein
MSSADTPPRFNIAAASSSVRATTCPELVEGDVPVVEELVEFVSSPVFTELREDAVGHSGCPFIVPGVATLLFSRLADCQRARPLESSG